MSKGKLFSLHCFNAKNGKKGRNLETSIAMYTLVKNDKIHLQKIALTLKKLRFLNNFAGFKV